MDAKLDRDSLLNRKMTLLVFPSRTPENNCIAEENYLPKNYELFMWVNGTRSTKPQLLKNLNILFIFYYNLC